jgi:site-specific DNA recombinase
MEEIEKLREENFSLRKELESLKKLRAEQQKKGMVNKASQGIPMSRPPFGYKFLDGKLTPAQNSSEVEEIFEEFLRTNISLTKLAKKHNFSVNGLKKILSNFTYVGKIKFNNEIYPGNHPPIISSTLFNHVQNKLERLNLN